MQYHIYSFFNTENLHNVIMFSKGRRERNPVLSFHVIPTFRIKKIHSMKYATLFKIELPGTVKNSFPSAQVFEISNQGAVRHTEKQK